MKHFFLWQQYIRYLLTAKSAHGIHSPFVFDFIETVLKDNRHFYAFDEINAIRKQLYNDTTLLEVEDLGAGSLHGNFKTLPVNRIAVQAGRNIKYGQLLFRIVNKFQCKHVLELGTSLGLGTAYLASACSHGKLITIEGSREIADYAGKTFTALSLQHIQQVVGNFDTVLPDLLKQNPAFDLVFIDGNHREEATLNYFQQLLPHIQENTLLIFDDIYWSRGMHKAWETICKHQSTRLSIDLFFFGLVFFKKEFKEKQHFILKY